MGRTSETKRTVTAKSGATAEAGTAQPSARMGNRIRELRHRDGLTLIQLADLAGLSHSFLSQVERGVAQPSMSSLHRIAQALRTTQDRLMAGGGAPGGGAEDPGPPIAVLHAHEGVSLNTIDEGPAPAGVARQLLIEPGGFYPTEFVLRTPVFDEFFRHEGNEFLYVAVGTIEVELDREDGQRSFLLATGDCLRYPGDVPHRWRLIGETDARLLMVHTQVRTNPYSS